MDINRLISITPSERQLAWHRLEFYAFVHYGINTYYEREWGDGKEQPSKFNPTELDTDQWVRSLVEGGLKGLILTCKHHDGFCLWPSAYTEHSVKNSPYKNGKGDIVREVSDSCKRYGIAFGVYLSPWDRNCKYYGDSPRYNEYFINQLTELLTGYGEIFSVWFDGACGEGANGKVQQYDWEAYHSTIRKLQPGAVINVCGPDVRWCGNEAGVCRKSEWNVVSKRLQSIEGIAAESQQTDGVEFRENPITSSDEDLGSREALAKEKDLVWYPAEVDTSIRPGWFYSENDDDKVRTLEELLNIYYSSVGGNASLLLNIPPDKRGLFHENDVERLKEVGDYLKSNFTDYIYNITSPTFTQNEDGSYEFSFSIEDDSVANHIILKENLAFSQRVERYEITAGNGFTYSGTVIGSKKIIKVTKTNIKEIKIKILQSRGEPRLDFIGICRTIGS